MRIINPHLPINYPKKIPVLFVHGVLLSMTAFLIHSSGLTSRRFETRCPLRFGEKLSEDDLKSLPLLLSNAGYDIWLLNTRGVGLSNKAANTSVNEPKYWSFNLDVLASEDFPAAVHYVRNATRTSTIGYVGHSQGTFLMFAAFSKYPELNELIKPAVAMAPIAYLDNLVGLSETFATWTHIVYETNSYENRCAIAPNLRQTVFEVCSTDTKMCNYLQTLTNGQSDMASYPAGYSSHLGFPTASQNLDHYYQLATYTRFSQYDFGPIKNLQYYRQSKPPNYIPARISNKNLVFVYGETDALSTPVDVRNFTRDLSVPLMKEIFLDGLSNHLDMIVSNSVGRRVNLPLFEMFESLSGC